MLSRVSVYHGICPICGTYFLGNNEEYVKSMVDQCISLGVPVPKYEVGLRFKAPKKVYANFFTFVVERVIEFFTTPLHQWEIKSITIHPQYENTVRPFHQLRYQVMDLDSKASTLDCMTLTEAELTTLIASHN